MNERGMFPHLLLGHLLLPQRLLGIQMKTIFSPRPLCLTVGVTSAKKIMKKVLVKLRRVPEIKSLARIPNHYRCSRLGRTGRCYDHKY
jgi:hypothetical protein